MAWFKRTRKGIQTNTKDKKDTPDGLWHKTPTGKIVDNDELVNNNFVSPEDNFHMRIGSNEYFNLLFDSDYEILFNNLKASDPLNFTDTKTYPKRVKEANKKTGLAEAISVAYGNSCSKPLTIASMDFSYIGGSMGSVVGEKISRAIDYSIKTKSPLLIISKSGGARMMEGAFSLMQMAKTSAKLLELSNNKIPYVSLCTDPTTGGTTASFAMLGDITIAEQGATIGFAGKRVIQDTIREELPVDFQKAEYLKDHGMVDIVSHRKDLKETLYKVLDHIS